jgi:Pentapeptide repeats (8 copies)
MSATDAVNQPKRIGRWIFIGAVIFFFVAVLAVIYIPQYQVKLLRERIEATQKIDLTQKIQLEKDYVDYANKARTTLAQIIGGLFVLGTIGVALWNAKIAQENARAAQQNAQAAQTNAETAQKNLLLTEVTAQKNYKLAEEGKLTDRFSKAVELLGSDKLDVRLGGIYALERIARDSQPDHWTVMEVLTAFIREKSKTNLQESLIQIEKMGFKNDGVGLIDFELTSDIETAITVIGRRRQEWIAHESDDQKLDLRGAGLVHANLRKANLSKANLANADLRYANFHETNLDKANLFFTDLRGAILTHACYLDDIEQLVWAIIDEDTKFPLNIESQRQQLIEKMEAAHEKLHNSYSTFEDSDIA